MAWQIELTGAAHKQLKKIGHAEAKRIRDYLRERIQPLEDPRQLGKPLQGQLGELWRYRVGDYRLIAQIEDDRVCVLVVRIGHRRDIYR
ncbi:type II toxin-antitoxin system RelE/ParE family toxin [Cobetia marina]|uniref:type II toxin-antitoxin system RelE family toxin n=1 Tax=Cobetia TaxID=204286 RepID=UPI000468ED24|nr:MULTISPECIES: type II toxin-antitoxin system RelE/ParE family toxin [Cobetia]MCK8069797.1 type II toxin-antitoxin system RelE/ParE family toxin [Cobetia sp. 1CM21F]TKD59212.1 type II toxin-antitoxin system RelE/ParE family toxin [Cobetia marina]TKD59221.1 type II toxin-antitoxin system RelE/ParE family toxin [Cobetia marina]